MRLFIRAAHFFHEVFFQQLGGGGRERGKTQRDDVRRQVVGAKNVADELPGSFSGGSTGNQALILGRLAKFARRLVESLSDSFDGDHSHLQQYGKNARTELKNF